MAETVPKHPQAAFSAGATSTDGEARTREYWPDNDFSVDCSEATKFGPDSAESKFVAAPAVVKGVAVSQLAPSADVTQGIRNGIGLDSTQSISWAAAYEIVGPTSQVAPDLEYGATTINGYVQDFQRLPNQTVWMYSNFSGGAIPNVPGFNVEMQRCEKMSPTYNPGMVPTFVAPAVVIRSAMSPFSAAHLLATEVFASSSATKA